MIHRSHPSAFYSLHAGRFIGGYLFGLKYHTKHKQGHRNWIFLSQSKTGTGVFGHLGDRVGRRTALSLSLLLVALPTAAMGCFHPLRTDGLHHSPGVATAWVVLRFLVGVGFGGHCGGPILLPLEYCTREKDGAKAAAVAHAGMPIGLALTSAAAYFLLLEQGSSPPVFQDGLRVAHLAVAALLVPVAVWAHVGAGESEGFEDVRLAGDQERWPLWGTLRRHGWAMVAGCLTILVDAVIQCSLLFYWPILLPHGLGDGGTWVNWCMAIALTMMGPFTVLGAYIREHVLTRCATYRMGAAVACAMMWLWFHLAQAHRRTQLLVADILVLAPGLGIMQGAMAALMAEAYPTSIAYTGVGLTYQCTQAIMHMVYPALAMWLLERGESSPIKMLQVEPGVNPLLLGLLILALTVVAFFMAGGLKGYERRPSISRPRGLLIRECVALSTPSQ